MLVTILTDASRCPDTGASGYGYWIASGRGKRPGGNAMGVTPCITTAEMMAIANALTVAVKAGLVQDGDDVLIQSDSTAATDTLQGRHSRHVCGTTEKMIEIKEYVRRFARDHHLNLEYRHVKAHTGRPEARFRANHHCDARAKTHMRRVRKELRQAATDAWAAS